MPRASGRRRCGRARDVTETGKPDGSGVCRKSRLRRYSASPVFGAGRAERGVAVLRRFFTGLVLPGPGCLRLELPADLTALMLGAVHVDVEIAGLERRILRVGQLRSGRDGPSIVAGLGERNDDGAVLAGGAVVNVRHRPGHASGCHVTAHGLVVTNRDRATARPRRRDGRYLLAPAQHDLNVLG